MSVLETTLVFVVIPLVVTGVLALLTIGVGGHHSSRYRPGRPFEFTPVWFLATPPTSSPESARADGRSEQRINRPGGPVLRTGDTSAPTRPAHTGLSGRKGGARGTW